MMSKEGLSDLQKLWISWTLMKGFLCLYDQYGNSIKMQHSWCSLHKTIWLLVFKNTLLKQAYHSSSFHYRIKEKWSGMGRYPRSTVNAAYKNLLVVKILMGFGMDKCFICLILDEFGVYVMSFNIIEQLRLCVSYGMSQ